VALLACAAAVAWYGSLPPRSESITTATIGAPADIRFDAWGRPYVTARTFEDALFAQGYLHARERLWQMELLRRAGRGRLAELFGGAAAEADIATWRVGVPALAARLEAAASTDTRARTASYVAGINAALAGRLVPPPEFALLATRPLPWTEHDVHAVAALLAWQSSKNLDLEVLRVELASALDAVRLEPFVPGADWPWPIEPAIGAGPGLAAFVDAIEPAHVAGLPSARFGSNAWALAPQRAAAGGAMLAFDSHDDLALPNLFHEVHLFDDAGQVRGWSLPGLPGVVNGYNDAVAWGFTATGDTQDLFVVPADAGIESESRVLPVRFGRGRAFAIERHALGPVVARTPDGRGLALAWTGHRIDHDAIGALLALNRADSAGALLDAAARIELPVSMLTFAARDGRIGQLVVGRLPIRASGDGRLPQPGTPGAAWRGLWPTAANPRLLDPVDGIVAAANGPVGHDRQGPLVSADFEPGYRIGRIRAALGARERHAFDDMGALQRDWRNPQAERVLPRLLEALDRAAASPRDLALIDALEAWQSAPDDMPDSVAALVFEHWYLALAEVLFADALGEGFDRLMRHNYVVAAAIDRLLLEPDPHPWWRGERDGMIRRAFARAVEAIAVTQGPDPGAWRWDRAQRVRLRHELGRLAAPLGWLFDGPERPWGGGPHTVGRANWRYARPFRVSHAATVRYVAAFGPERPRVAAAIPGGQGGHPSSRHYLDQFDAWLEGRLLPVASRPEELGPATIFLWPQGSPPPGR
jgi:penicillin amidase